MISRLLRHSLINCYYFSSSVPKIVNGKAYADLPSIEYPTKPKPQNPQQYPMSLAYESMNYLRKDRLPNCKYFAMQYNNRIYHFYNAYYYPLGRMINRVATQIRGKTSPLYKNHTANIKNGDICVIVNIEDPLVTGKKLLYKKFRYHTGFVGHLKEYTYKHVLNHKPELLYHYLLRRVMPKNKLSQKYFQNVVLCRGPTHNFNQFPQFAPDKKRYSMLAQTDFIDIIKNSNDVSFVEQSSPGIAKDVFGKEIPKYVTPRDRLQMERESQEVISDLNKIHEDVPKFKQVPDITKRQYEVMVRKEKRIEDRYRPVRAPFKKSKKLVNENLKVYTSEKKARKDPNYELLKNEELEQIDEELTAPNPHTVGATYEKDQKDQ